MPESLWQAVQHEAEKQQLKGSTELPISPTQVTAEGRTAARPAGPPGHPPEDRTGLHPLERPETRPTRRRPYDFYTDQILWLNEMKWSIEKRYGKRITANAMVQLAVDMLIEDYQRNQERSRLVSALVSNQT